MNALLIINFIFNNYENFIIIVKFPTLKLTLHFLFILDFPGMCFASTRCATVEPGKSWELAPFCGRSTCVVSEDKIPK